MTVKMPGFFSLVNTPTGSGPIPAHWGNFYLRATFTWGDIWGFQSTQLHPTPRAPRDWLLVLCQDILGHVMESSSFLCLAPPAGFYCNSLDCSWTHLQGAGGWESKDKGCALQSALSKSDNCAFQRSLPKVGLLWLFNSLEKWAFASLFLFFLISFCLSPAKCMSKAAVILLGANFFPVFVVVLYIILRTFANTKAWLCNSIYFLDFNRPKCTSTPLCVCTFILLSHWGWVGFASHTP